MPGWGTAAVDSQDDAHLTVVVPVTHRSLIVRRREGVAVNVGVLGLVVAQHLWRRVAAVQIRHGLDTRRVLTVFPLRVERLGAMRKTAARTPSPRPQRLSSGPARRGQSNDDLLLANSRLSRCVLYPLSLSATRLVVLVVGWGWARCRTFLEYGHFVRNFHDHHLGKGCN